MKLLLYELYKLSKKKIIVTLVPILLLCNGWMYIQQEMMNHQQIIEHRELYTEYETNFRALPARQAYQQALETRDRLSGFQIYLFMQRSGNTDTAQLFENDANYQRYGSLYPNSEYAQHESLLILHSHFISTIIEQLEALQAYSDYVEQIEVQADNMLQYDIFNDPNSFSYRNIRKTTADFEQVKQVPLQLGLDYGVVSGTSFRMTDVIMLFILIILGIFVFHTEREQGQMLLLRTMKYGRMQLLTSKLLLIIASAFVIALLFYGTILLLANVLYGFGDGSRYIQSMGAYKFANLPLTVYEYLTWFLIGKIVMCVVLALLFSFILLLFNHLSKSLIVLTVMLSASYFAYQFIHASSYLNLLKYINIIALFDTSQLLTNYVNLNLLGHPITRIWVSLIIIGLLALMLIAGCSIAYAASSAKPNGSSALWWRTTVQLTAKWLNPIHQSISLVWHESMKQLWTARGWIIVAVALLISVQDVQNAKLVMDNDQFYYNEYMDQLSGPLTDDKIAFVEDEWARRNNAGHEFQQVSMQYQAGDISFEQYKATEADAELLKLSQEAFNKIYSQYEYLLEMKQTSGADVYFVNQYAADYLFNNVNRDQMNVMIIGLLLTIYLSSVYTVDSRQQMLLKTTKRGRQRLFATVWLLGLGVATIILMTIYLPQYINVVRLYPAIDWHAPIQSLEQYENWAIPITLYHLVVLVSICQWISVASISIVILLLAQLLRRFSLTLLSGIALVLCPTVTAWLSFHMVTKYTLHYPHLMYQMLGEQRIGEVIAYFIGLTVLMMVCLWLAWRHYNTGQIWRVSSGRHSSTKEYTEKGIELK